MVHLQTSSEDGPLVPLPHLSRQHMPTDFEISVDGCGGVDRILYGPRRARRQELPGFEATYEDIVDYILRITYRIWEDKHVDYITATYHPDARVTGGGGLQPSRQAIIDETEAHLRAFPDLRLLPEDVVWAGDASVGYRTSHRLWETGHHTGAADFGPVTGRLGSARAIANCVVVENYIVEEWVLDNTTELLASMGLDHVALARRWAEESDLAALATLHSEIEKAAVHAHSEPVAPDGPGDPAASGGQADPERYLRHALDRLWNHGELDVVDTMYADNAPLHGATGREFRGRRQIAAETQAWRQMFPDLVRMTDEVYWQGNPHDGFLVSLRWSTVGTHDGEGPYGPPTGRRVSAWGISQYAIKWGRVLEEWTLFNELEVLQQIHRSAPLS